MKETSFNVLISKTSFNVLSFRGAGQQILHSLDRPGLRLMLSYANRVLTFKTKCICSKMLKYFFKKLFILSMFSVTSAFVHKHLNSIKREISRIPGRESENDWVHRIWQFYSYQTIVFWNYNFITWIWFMVLCCPHLQQQSDQWSHCAVLCGLLMEPRSVGAHIMTQTAQWMVKPIFHKSMTDQPLN